MPPHAADLSFTWTDQPDPHRMWRRRLLNAHPEIRGLMGYDRRTAWVAGAVVVVQLGVAWALAQLASAHLIDVCCAIVASAYVIGAVLSHWSAMVIHECSHNLAARTRTGNRAVALLANVPMLLPAAETFRRYHIGHHAHLGEYPGGDTDIAHPVEVRLVGNSSWRKALWLACYLLVYVARGMTFARRPNRGELVNLVLQVAVVAVIAATMGWIALAYLALSTFFGHSLHPVAAHFIHEHYSFAEGQETFSYYGALNRVTFNVGYHVEHHDFMNIPGWNLPKLNALAPERYEQLVSHRSWTLVLLRFIFDPRMHPASRVVRRVRDRRGHCATGTQPLGSALP